MSGGKNTFSIRADMSAFDRFIDQLGTDVEEAARPAAQAGAQVLYEEVKRNVSSMRKVTGNLERSIYQAFSRDQSGPGRATYHIGWNSRKAPHGHLLEYGYMQRYVMVKFNDGTIRPAVRPGMDGRLSPGRNASLAQKDAYYIPLPGGPRHIAARSFVRRAASATPRALAAAETELMRYIHGGPLRGAR